MKNKEINIAEILKNCPKGTKLYSTICGECELDTVDVKRDYPIDVIYKNANNHEDVETFTKDGRYRYVGECVLFPSRDNRDWATFKAPKKEYEFKPFDKVLFRNHGYVWSVGFFSHKTVELGGNAVYYNIGGFNYDECIPYEGNEHLLGTTDSPNEE